MKKKLKGKIRKYFEMNRNKTCQNLWDIAKAVLGGKFVALDAYIKIWERSLIYSPLCLEKEEQIKIQSKHKEGNN